MVGDILLVTPNDYNRADEVRKQLKSENIILIGGISGTAKSELAYCLQKSLFEKNSKSSMVISLDDYYYTMPSIRDYNRKKQGIESVGLSEIDWESVKRIYKDFVEKRSIHFKRVHRFLDAIEHNTIKSDIDFLIFEGLYTNYLKKFYSNNLSIFLEGTPDQTLEFRKQRRKENEDDSFRKKIVKKESNVIVQLKKYADLILEFKTDGDNQ